jgi:hypothetical protein
MGARQPWLPGTRRRDAPFGPKRSCRRRHPRQGRQSPKCSPRRLGQVPWQHPARAGHDYRSGVKQRIQGEAGQWAKCSAFMNETTSLGAAGPAQVTHLRILRHAASLGIYERLPPRLRFGSERAVFLCRQGHDDQQRLLGAVVAVFGDYFVGWHFHEVGSHQVFSISLHLNHAGEVTYSLRCSIPKHIMPALLLAGA